MGMQGVGMGAGLPATPPGEPDALGLAQALCTRLCHDLGGPTGALSGALELVEGPGDEAMEVARDAAQVIDRRVRFWRTAVGGAPGDLDAAAITVLAEGLTLGRRATVSLEGLAPGCRVPAPVAQPLLLAMLVAVEALPRGGVVRVAGGPEGFAIRPEGVTAAWAPGLAEMLAGLPPALTPRGVALPLLAATASAAGLRLALVGVEGGIGALALTPR